MNKPDPMTFAQLAEVIITTDDEGDDVVVSVAIEQALVAATRHTAITGRPAAFTISGKVKAGEEPGKLDISMDVTTKLTPSKSDKVSVFCDDKGGVYGEDPKQLKLIDRR